MGKHRIPEDKFIKGTGTRKYINSRQCAAMYRKGARTGMRCSWYATEGSEYCVKHNGSEGKKQTPEHNAKAREGPRRWWERMHALEAKYPGLLRQVMKSDQAAATRATRREVEKTMPKPLTDDKHILKAHKAIVDDIAQLPAVPDKPFDDLEPHEQLTVITGQSLKVVHQVLSFQMQDPETKEVNLKVASMVKDTALRALSVRVKIDRNALNARKHDKIAELLERLKGQETPGDNAKVIDN